MSWLWPHEAARPTSQRLGRADWLTSDKEAVMGVVVSLIRHAHDATTPASTSWLLATAVATGLLALVLTEQALADAERLSVVFHPFVWRWPQARRRP
jgi:hypothetical protein